MAGSSKRVLIVGGGVGGLAAAVRLAAAGQRVILLEKNARVGGKLNLWQAPHPDRPNARPFRFDTGPSLLTLPFVFEDLFAAAGERLQDHLILRRLDPIARFTWADGTRFELHSDPAAMEREVELISPQDVSGWRELFQRGQKIWNLTADAFLFHAPEQLFKSRRRKDSRFGAQGSAKTEVQDSAAPHFQPSLEPQSPNPRAGAVTPFSLLTVPFRIGMFTTFAGMIDRYLKHPRLREVMYQYATYSGASPFRAPATLGVIPYAEMNFGGWHIEGGLYRLAEALAKIAKKLGVEIRVNCPVESVLIDGADRRRPRAAGVRLADRSEIAADAVILNSDVVYSYRSLIHPAWRRRFSDVRLNKLDPGGSGMVLLLGVEGKYPQLAHHTKFMPADYTSDLTAMFETRTLPADPCIYVCASTRTHPSQAPEGCENLFVLSSAPALDGKIAWATQGPVYRRQLVKTLQDRWGMHDLEERIVVERTITPFDLQSLYNANAGSIYGIGSNSRAAAFLRPPNRDRDIRGLYFAGGATHPGGGLPLVALSGKIVSELILEDAAP